MPQQVDLFQEPPLSVEVPEDLTEPRLWVRRLKIWKEPGGEVIRDIELRPGLNIIWSPDGDDDPDGSGGAIGHGSGKTLFCRLLRYCIGETRFADEVQRDAISTRFPNGVVGAEVMLEGACWAVARPLGTGRKHFAIENGNLDAVAKMKGSATGMAPLIDTIDRVILGETTAQLIGLPAGQRAWPIALAWAARDQECRFDDVLDWRSSSSGSDTPQPASGDAKGPRLLAMRALLQAITEDEQIARRLEQELASKLDEIKQQRSHLEWDQKRRLNRLVHSLGLIEASLPAMPLLLDSLRSIADEGLAAAAKLPSGNKTELGDARHRSQIAQSALQEAEVKLAEHGARLPVENKLLTQMTSELPGLSAAAQSASSPVCPICEVPIDAVLAEGCELSHNLPDPAECRARLDEKLQDVEEQKQTVADIEAEIAALKPAIALARQNVQRAQDLVDRLEAVADARNTSWRAAARNAEDVQRCAEQVD
ncbi:MAG: hypothetical protein KDE55_25140, partial [Novosphingobium sp.]|nr:hypothetical protein [Novosphingobium sp.]